MDKTISILDDIDILNFIPSGVYNYNISILMDVLNTFVNESDKYSKIISDEYFENDLFNNMNECEFIDYLYNRYGSKIMFNTYTVHTINKVEHL